MSPYLQACWCFGGTGDGGDGGELAVVQPDWQRPARDEWVIFESEAEIVRRILRLYVESLSMKAIAAKLNAEGVPFPGGTGRTSPQLFHEIPRKEELCPPNVP